MTCRSFMTNALAALLLASSTAGHMIMENPMPFANDVIDSEPLGQDDWPCKKGNGFNGPATAMAVGDTQTLKFRPGGAVHGGGSCQLSITLDEEPNADSTFKVIHSVEGGCPGSGTVGQTFDYTLPDSIPSGNATFAWSWFSKLSGAPEMYMNCARISVTGGASDSAGFDQLPDMLVANIGGVSDCTSPQNYDTIYPDAGDSVARPNKQAELKKPAGQCGPAVDSPPAPEPTTEAPAPTTTQAPPAEPTTPSFTTSVIPTSSAPEPSTPAPPPTTGGDTCSGSAMLCNGGDQFGLCDNGNVVWQAVAPGTQCENGQIVRKRSRVVRRRVTREWAL